MIWRGWRGSNPRPSASEADTLSTELQPLKNCKDSQFYQRGKALAGMRLAII